MDLEQKKIDNMGQNTIGRLDSLPKYNNKLGFGEFITGEDFPRLLQGLCITEVTRNINGSEFILTLTDGYKIHIILNDSDRLEDRISPSNLPNLHTLVNPYGVITDSSTFYYNEEDVLENRFRVTAIYSDGSVNTTSGYGCDEILNGYGGFFITVEKS